MTVPQQNSDPNGSAAPVNVNISMASDLNTNAPSDATLRLWNEVAQGIDKNSTVVWKSAVDSLTEGRKYILSSPEARSFVERYMRKVLQILLEQVPQKIGHMEKNCVQESLLQGVLISFDDLNVKSDAATGDSTVLGVLAMIFNKKMQFYKGSKHGWNNNMNGLPEVRMLLVDKFKSMHGFGRLGAYLEARVGTPSFPPPTEVKFLLDAARDAVPGSKFEGSDDAKKALEDEIIKVSKAVMKDMEQQSEDALKKISLHDDLNTVRWSLQSIFQALIGSRRNETYEFYDFCRKFSLKLITSQSLPLKLYGWETVNELIDVSQDMAPPPAAFLASGAGNDFINGPYVYASDVGEDGFVHPKTDHSYQYDTPPGSEPNAKSRKLTLFKCTMRSQQKWWFISEADVQQPGTDKDIDYYQQKSKKNEENLPPSTGWMTCRNGVVDPPPYLEANGVVVPPGEEYNTMEHQMAKWAIDNKVVELVLGSSIHREIVARSTRLLCFLVQMCTKDELVTGANALPSLIPNQYCLISDHLDLAWKTCTSKLDAAVSAEVYELLVAILPPLPNELAVDLLNTIRKSCHDSLYEVGEFCSTLAASFKDEGVYLSHEVRSVLLTLLWSVLTHPDASTLKCFDQVKSFMTQELRVEPNGTQQRQVFLDACKEALVKNSTSIICEEISALRMVRLTRFILEACPLEQAATMITKNDNELGNLTFNELVAYLRRRSSRESHSLIKKTSSNVTLSEEFQHSFALGKRLGILRVVYGISDTVELSSAQLDMLWQLCVEPEDREAIMLFLANSSYDNGSPATMGPSLPDDASSAEAHQALTAAYSDDVKVYAFQQLFCSENVHWEHLGPKSYQSFQGLFKSLRKSVRSTLTSNGPALDALWRICLVAGNDHVASQAMRDLLSVYSAMSESKRQNEANAQNAWSKKNAIPEVTLDKTEMFSYKIFHCLTDVRERLQKDDPLAVRSAERCIRILNAAVGHNPATDTRVSALVKSDIIDSIGSLIASIPHGYRGQGCYKTINAIARRTGNQSTRSRNRPQTERISIQIHPLETLNSLKTKVALACDHPPDLVKPISMDNNKRNLNIEADCSIVGDLGITEGTEIVFLLAPNPFPESKQPQNKHQNERRSGLRPDEIFGGSGHGPTDDFFNALLDVLESLRLASLNNIDTTQQLVWDLLQSVPSNVGIVEKVRDTSQVPTLQSLKTENERDQSSMKVDIERRDDIWSQLLNPEHYAKSIYVLQIIDSFLQPATEVLQKDRNQQLIGSLIHDSSSFRQGFIESGGFDSVLRFFVREKSYDERESSNFRMENCCVMRILKACFYGRSLASSIAHGEAMVPPELDTGGSALLKSVDKVDRLLTNLTAAVVMEKQVTSASVTDALMLIQSVLMSDPTKTVMFATLPGGLAKRMIVSLLLWNSKRALNASAIVTSLRIRKSAEEFILKVPNLSQFAFPWLITALGDISIVTPSTHEFFSVLIGMVSLVKHNGEIPPKDQLQSLSDSACKKISSYPSGQDLPTTGVICGCLKIVRALIDRCGGEILRSGVDVLLTNFHTSPWVKVPTSTMSVSETVLVNLMGVIFDGFLSEGPSPASSSCNDAETRQVAFDILNACAMGCEQGAGYLALSSRIENIINGAAPSLRHRWGQENIGLDDEIIGGASANSKYSGLKNQGCTCYMNSVLQQLFMMPELRKTISNATLPAALRSTCTSSQAKGVDLVDKEVTLQWENGSYYYDAKVLSFNKVTGTHIIRYHPVRISDNSNNVNELALAASGTDFSEEFILSEGRPGKETGIFEMVDSSSGKGEGKDTNERDGDLKETEDEYAYRRLLEEVQRTFVHLDEGSKGRVFDPKSLVEASGCLKLEFDVWQQNDASEFAMKLLDKLEVPLKKWSPSQFKFLEHTFRLKQTKQKLCKECGLKTNREENLMNIDCQIRGKSDIHEALSTMCEVEYMEGDNKVFCDNCKKNCDTVLRTAISALPDMLILSLKRFDLDYNTFETVKLNSRCEFGQTLNMKRYTLEGVEAMEKANETPDTSESTVDPLSALPDEDYEYRLAGVLVHHGVAQGGHYYSFIRDRTTISDSSNEWFRFDDEDVTPFDPSNIETECFGGKVKKETKWPNGQVNSVETEQLANALMVFYEKVKPTKFSEDNPKDEEMVDANESTPNELEMVTGTSEFKADVSRSNTLHQSHSFLFDKEFQGFMKQMLNLVVLDLSSDRDENMISSTPARCQIAILNVCICFYFDVLLHHIEKDALDDWSASLYQAFYMSTEASVGFISDLANRTNFVAANWLQTYATDCPDIHSREAAMALIATAIGSALHSEQELHLLSVWTQNWAKQVDAWEKTPRLQKILPVCLDNETTSPSNMGNVLAFVCALLEYSPRTWRYLPELCSLLKNLGNIPSSTGGDFMRNALLAAQIPARLICTILREKAHPILRAALPGSSLSAEVVEQTSKVESAPSSHLLPLNSNSVAMGSGLAPGPASGCPSPADHSKAVEALAAIIGVQGTSSVPLVTEGSTGRVKNRPVVELTDQGTEALTILFNEYASQPGTMRQKDLLRYMKVCCTSEDVQQRVANLLNKYTEDPNCLSLDGFLGYYRDASQSNEHEVRSDLHAFGFRSDLSRCPEDARVYKKGDDKSYFDITERVVKDVSMMASSDICVSCGHLAEYGLTSLHLYHIASFSSSSHLAEYILALTVLRHHNLINLIISEALKTLYLTQGNWSGNEVVQVIQMVLKVLASVEGDDQQTHINNIMLSNDRVNARKNIGEGLLIVAKDLAMARSTQNYSTEYSHESLLLDTYIEVISGLKKLQAVENWMAENKEAWSWLEQWLHPDAVVSDRADYSRRDGAVRQGGYDQSDSDLNGGLNDSDDDDDDSHFEDGIVQVEGAGIIQINGIYTWNSTWDSVDLFTKTAVWENTEQTFSLFRCRLSDNSKRWYISIVPKNNNPGTSKDIDFYFQVASGEAREVPGLSQWASATGPEADPSPTVQYQKEIGQSDFEAADDCEQ